MPPPQSSAAMGTPLEVLSTLAPPAPADVMATAGNAQVVLTWSASAEATGYLVERATTPGGPYVQAGTPSTTTFTDTGLGNGRSYYYVVRATSSGGTSLPSAEASAMPRSGSEVCVVNENAHTVAVFDPTSSGDVQPLRRLGHLTHMNNVSAVALDRVNDEIYVANSAGGSYPTVHPITVYARTADGNVAPVRYISGPDTGLHSAVGLAVDPVHDELFVSVGGSISVFPRTAHGNVRPLRTLSLSSYCGPCGHGISVDPVHGELFVPGGTFSRAMTYARTARNLDAPLRMLSGSYTQIAQPSAVAYDAVHDEIIVTSTDSYSVIGVFPRTASGDVFPTRAIYAGNPGGVKDIKHVAVDDPNGDIYVTSWGGTGVSIAVYPRTFDGAVPPARRIMGPDIGVTRPYGIAVSPATAELFVTDGSARRLVVHSTSATDNVAPLRTLSGLPSGIYYPNGIAAARSSGKVFVSNAATAFLYGGGSSVTSHATTWTGSPTPLSTLTGTATQLSQPRGIAVDEINGEVFVLNSGSVNSVVVHSMGAQGDTAPVRTLAGSLTTLSRPSAIAVDPLNGELFVANQGDKTITVFARTAKGNVAPIRKLGPTSSLGTPTGIALDTKNNEIVVLNRNGTVIDITVFRRNASGATTALRRISGTFTQIGSAMGVAVDAERNEILVANLNAAAIQVYPRMGTGNVTPLRTISGPSTMISRPYAITMCK